MTTYILLHVLRWQGQITDMQATKCRKGEKSSDSNTALFGQQSAEKEEMMRGLMDITC